jgi:hypothetical protein
LCLKCGVQGEEARPLDIPVRQMGD